MLKTIERRWRWFRIVGGAQPEREKEECPIAGAYESYHFGLNIHISVVIVLSSLILDIGIPGARKFLSKFCFPSIVPYSCPRSMISRDA